MTPTERRENCARYQGVVDDLKKAVFGNGQPGLKEDMMAVKTKMTILMSLQLLCTGALITGVIKLVFFMGP